MARKCDAASKASSASAEKLVSAVEELAEKLGTRFDIIDELFLIQEFRCAWLYHTLGLIYYIITIKFIWR